MFHSYMQEALNEAKKAQSLQEVPVGAIIVDPQRKTIIAAAHNLTETTYDPTAHAELLAIRQACHTLKTPRLEGLDMYVSLEPCPMCAQAIAFARIRRLYFAAYDEKGGGVEHGARVFSAPSCHHRPEIYGGMEETDASLLLKRFFKTLRKL